MIKLVYDVQSNEVISNTEFVTIFIRIKARLKYRQGLKYTPGSAAE